MCCGAIVEKLYFTAFSTRNNVRTPFVFILALEHVVLTLRGASALYHNNVGEMYPKVELPPLA